MTKKGKMIVCRMAGVLFVVYVMILVYFLFFSERYGRTAGAGEYRYNLVLFKEIKRFWNNRELVGLESFAVNLFGNVLAFVPFGFALPIISPRNRKFLNIALLSLELTLTIELMQLLLKVGIFDIDDIFLNTLGGMCGYFMFALCCKFVKRGKRNG